MKLIYCPQCMDVLALFRKARMCMCGKSGGAYTDELNAEIYGEAIALGFANISFLRAVNSRPEKGWGKEFEAFVVPRVCNTITRIKRDD